MSKPPRHQLYNFIYPTQIQSTERAFRIIPIVSKTRQRSLTYRRRSSTLESERCSIETKLPPIKIKQKTFEPSPWDSDFGHDITNLL
ncbi:hypothetical protein pb186bvf_008862 [Paramecium bursaria]